MTIIKNILCGVLMCAYSFAAEERENNSDQLSKERESRAQQQRVDAIRKIRAAQQPLQDPLRGLTIPRGEMTTFPPRYSPEWTPPSESDREWAIRDPKGFFDENFLRDSNCLDLLSPEVAAERLENFSQNLDLFCSVVGIGSPPHASSLSRLSHEIPHSESLHDKVMRNPESFVNERFNRTTGELNMTFQELKEEALKAIIPYVEPLASSIKSLNFTNTNLTARGVEILAPSLSLMKNLEELVLGSNNIKEQGLGENNIGDEGVKILLPYLKSLPNLERLDMSGNNISSQAYKDLLPHLPSKISMSSIGESLDEDAKQAYRAAGFRARGVDWCREQEIKDIPTGLGGSSFNIDTSLVAEAARRYLASLKSNKSEEPSLGNLNPSRSSTQSTGDLIPDAGAVIGGTGKSDISDRL